MENIISELNNFSFNYSYFELSISSYENGNLIIVGSEDLLYFHQIEIVFIEVYTILCNTNFIINTSFPFIELLNERSEELYKLNVKYRVVQGYKIYKLVSEDNDVYYIIAKGISYNKLIVKY